MMKTWSFILAVLSVSFVLTNAQEQFQQVIAELRNKTSKTRHEKLDEFEKISRGIESLMVPNADPCGNFYDFVCGNYSQPTLFSYDYALEEIKRDVLSKYEQEGPLESEKELAVIKHSRNLYKSCKKTKNEKGFNDFILGDLEEIGGWPALKGNSWKKSAFNWKRLVFKAGNQNIWKNCLMRVSILKTKDNIADLQFDPITYNHQFALEFAARLGGNNLIVKKELEKVNEFSKTFLKEFSSHLNVKQNPTKMTLKNFIDKYPDYPWLEYLKYIEPNIQLTDIVVVPSSAYMEYLFSLLNNADERMLANIVAHNRIAYLDEYFTRYNEEEDCFSMTLKTFNPLQNFLYIREFGNDNNTKEATQSAETISNKIRQQFVQILRNADWISNKTNAIEKLEKLYYEFGYPSDLFLDNLMNKYYEKLRSNQSNFYEALFSITEFQRILPFDKKLDENRPALTKYFRGVRNIMEAEYRNESNSILVKPGLLQRQFLDIHRPMWMSFAMFGSIIGHEFGQSLNSHLIELNVDEKFTSWSKDSNSYIGFHKKKRCLTKMYRDFAEKNGYSGYVYYSSNKEIDVANYLGLRAAYLAYKNLSVKENNRILNGKEYSPNQLFWIYATNRFCTAEYRFNVNSRKIMILASLSNIDGFSRDFKCPENSEMNHHEQCSIV